VGEQRKPLLIKEELDEGLSCFLLELWIWWSCL